MVGDRPCCLVFVDVGVEWMVTLTAAAVAELELAEGVEVFAIVKASAVAVSALHRVAPT
jgi:molybdopterin-binding protein